MSISKDEIYKTCETGDLILFNTRSHWYDFLIERVTGSKFSHVGMVVRDISYGDVSDIGICLLESGYESFPDAVKHDDIYGVQFAELDKVFSTYLGSGGRGGYAYYRKLECKRDDDFFSMLKGSISEVYGKPYDLLPQDWFKSAFDIHKGNEQRTNTFWCSALVSYIYDKLGFIERNTPWTIIQPTQFSYYEGRQLSFSSKIELAPEILIVD
jgi:hypothetical protein